MENSEQVRLKDFIPVTGVVDYFKRNENNNSFFYKLNSNMLVTYNLGIAAVTALSYYLGLEKLLR